MWAYPYRSIRGTCNRAECHLQTLATIPRGWYCVYMLQNRPPTTPNEDRYLTVTAYKHTHRNTSSDLSRQLSSTTDTATPLACVMFSDESRFDKQSDSRLTFIRCPPGTLYHQDILFERCRYDEA
ncbi:transposable element Tcb1 transposase [Trichonephila clavipes]|nr:transposable element Tcb1 transposase [Trichonephila clavipes]